MDRWLGKIAIVTGASSGIGAGVAVSLVRAGVIVIGLARRADRIERLRDQLPANLAGSLHAFRTDLAKEEDILAAFDWVKRRFGGIDILVNVAGVYHPCNIVDAGNSAALRESLEINVLALALCAREAFRSMKERSVDGHIVLLNSIGGHYILRLPIPDIGPLNMESPSKYAVTAITEVLRQEFINERTKVKVTSISPGTVKTDILTEEMKALVALNVEDIADAILYVLATPPHVQVHELTIRSVGELF